MNVVFYANIILRTHVCICMCVYLTYKCYIAMEISSRGSTYPEMFCALERFDSAQFLSHATRTHILPFPERVPTKHTNTPQPYEPHLFLFFPLVYLPLLACLGSVLLFQDCSVHLLIRSTEALAMSRHYSALSWPSGSPYTTACHPDPGIQTRCLTEGINHPCLHNWPGRPLSTRPGAVPVPSATADTGISM